MHPIFGEMAEWSIAAVLKTVELRGSGGSNPSLSARKNKGVHNGLLLFFMRRHRAFSPHGREFLSRFARTIITYLTHSARTIITSASAFVIFESLSLRRKNKGVHDGLLLFFVRRHRASSPHGRGVSRTICQFEYLGHDFCCI